MQTLQAWRFRRGLTGKAIAITAVGLLALTLGALAKAEVKSVTDLAFTRVLLVGSNEVELTQGKDAALKIRGEEDELDPLPFILRDDTLILGIDQSGHSVQGVQYKVTASGLEALQVEGSGDAYVKPLAVGDLVVSLEGSGNIRMFDIQALDLEMRVMGSGALQAVDCKARNARLNVRGSGDLQLGSIEADVIRAHLAGSGDITVEDGGQAGELEVKLMGSGDVGMDSVTTDTADVSIMGSGDVRVRVNNRIDAKIMGSGDLVFGGSPEVNTSVLGSGDVRQAD
jgi:hypothetical protein